MTRSLSRLGIFVGTLAAGVVCVNLSMAAPKVTTVRTAKVTLPRGTTINAAGLTNATRLALLKRKTGATVYAVQIRSPLWQKSASMDASSALVTRQVLRHHGYSAHLHDQGTNGVFVHYSQTLWNTRGLTTTHASASQAAAFFRTLGFQARVVTKRVS